MFGSPRGTDQVQRLNASIERVYEAAAVSQQGSEQAMAALRTLAGGQFQGDALGAYAALQQAVDRSLLAQQGFADAVRPMQAAARDLFAGWETELGTYANADLQQRSRQRLDATRQRYQALAEVAEQTLAAHGRVNQTLQDHIRFFGRDLNPSAMAAVQAELGALQRMAADLGHRLDDTRAVARAYADAATPPPTGGAAAPSAPAAPAAEGARPAARR